MTRWPLALAAAALSAALLLPLVPLAIQAFARGWRFPDLLPRDATPAGWQAASTGPGKRSARILNASWRTPRFSWSTTNS